MTFLLLFVGVISILAAVVDALWTTITAAGGGPLTRFLSRMIWQNALRLHRRRPSHRFLIVAGAVILLAVLSMWILLLWTGYVLLFSIEPGAVVHSQSEAIATFWERVYFTGFTLFTLGIGDIIPQGSLWRVVTALASLNGLFLITLSITYLVSVLSAVVAKRQLAGTIANVGMSPQEIVLRSLTSDRSGYLIQHLAQLVPMIEHHTQRHLAFPVLHFFHSNQPRAAVTLRLAALDEALLLLENGVGEEGTPSVEALAPVRRAIGAFLDTLHEVFIIHPPTPPPAPDTSRLQERGLSITPEELGAAVGRSADRRRLLQAFVEDDGWTWGDVSAYSNDALSGPNR